jgi:hypothetical protein
MKRPARFSFRAKSFLAACLSFVCCATFAAEEDIPKLRPPHDELQPSFWELHGWWTVAGIVLVLAALEFFIVWLRRPKPDVLTPPEILARRALENLRGRTEDAALVVEVTRILRRYILLAFGLAPDELTTAEIRRVLQHSNPVSPDLAAAITDFLRECDERKFAPAPRLPQTGAVDRALALLEQVETSRRQKPQSVSTVTGSGPVSSSAS